MKKSAPVEARKPRLKGSDFEAWDKYDVVGSFQLNDISLSCVVNACKHNRCLTRKDDSKTSI